MALHTWKAWERWWGETLEKMGFGPTQRIPVTGRSSGDVPDLDNAILAPEVKAGKDQVWWIAGTRVTLVGSGGMGTSAAG